MSGLDLITRATFLFILHWAFFYWLIGRVEHYGHTVAWGVVRGIRISREERRRRLWSLWFSHLFAVGFMPLMVGFGFWEMAELTEAAGARRLVRLYAIVDFAFGFGLLVMASIWMANLARRVREGKYGFVGNGADPLSNKSLEDQLEKLQ